MQCPTTVWTFPRRCWLAGLLAALVVFVGACGGTGSSGTSERADAQATRLASRAVRAAGGRRVLVRPRYLNFDLVVQVSGKPTLRRKHLWDRSTGRYRLEATLGDKPALALINLATRQGKVLTGYAPFLHEAPASAVSGMCNLAQTDNDWILSTAKLLEPDRRVTYVGENALAGTAYPTLFVTAGGLGTPVSQDKYWFFIDPETGLPKGWAFVLGGREQAPVSYLLSQWRKVAGYKLPTQFDRVGGGEQITVENLYFPTEVYDSVFEQERAVRHNVGPGKP